MKTHENKIQSNERKPDSNHVAENMTGRELTSHFEDNRSVTVTQQKLQETADRGTPMRQIQNHSHSPGAGSQYRTIQEKSEHPYVRQIVQQQNEAPTHQSGGNVIQRVLGVGQTIIAADITNVFRVPDKLVYILTGHAGDKVVVKFEMPGGNETVPQLGGRERATHTLARQVLNNVPDAQHLTLAEILNLQGLNPGVVTGDVADLTGNLNKGLAVSAVALKIESVNVGDSLEEMIENDNVTPDLFSKTMLTQFGKMAFFDLLVSNTDRFRPGGDVNVQNIDFTATGNETLPLDNLDPFGGGISQSLNEFEGLKNVVNADARKEYAFAAFTTLAEKANQKMPSGKKYFEMIGWFEQGMETAARLCKAQELRLQFQQPGTPEGETSTGLLNRLRAIKI